MNHDEATRLFYQHLWPHRAMVLRTARFLTRNHAEADDLAQETMVKAFKSIDRFDWNANDATTKGWLSAILRNTWIDRLRSTGRHSQNLSLDHEELDFAAAPAATLADPHDPASLLENFSDGDLITALHALPEEIRWTVLLVDVEGMDHAQAATILNIPEGTVKSRAFRGRRMLREHLTSLHLARAEDRR